MLYVIWYVLYVVLMLHEICIFYQFLPRRRLDSTNFYRAGAPSQPISTAPAPPFYQFLPVSTAPRSPFYPKKPNKSTMRKHNSTNFCRAVFEILPIGGFGISTVFYLFSTGSYRAISLPMLAYTTCWAVYVVCVLYVVYVVDVSSICSICSRGVLQWCTDV